MTLTQQQIDDLKPWQTHLLIWERDLLHLAGRFEGWLDIAIDHGFTVEKVMRPWTHPDAGRRIKVMTWDEYKFCTSRPSLG
jgi:hypothetical protein